MTDEQKDRLDRLSREPLTDDDVDDDGCCFVSLTQTNLDDIRAALATIEELEANVAEQAPRIENLNRLLALRTVTCDGMIVSQGAMNALVSQRDSQRATIATLRAAVGGAAVDVAGEGAGVEGDEGRLGQPPEARPRRHDECGILGRR